MINRCEFKIYCLTFCELFKESMKLCKDYCLSRNFGGKKKQNVLSCLFIRSELKNLEQFLSHLKNQ